MYKIPKFTMVLGEKVKTLWSETNIESNGNWLIGLFRPDDMTITMAKGYSPRYIYRMYLHEVGHAICFITGLSQTLTDAQEEQVVQSFASHQLQQEESKCTKT